ncbi:hypothetical protein TNIN_152751 [Trichonephila inaurata madagascariensis]|uniref:Uncharacterized protein n=1 Tax=Trichonephila inaurata madagascariensis TaxID=2747483 RepID=A0A8X6J9W1_9ARAC|nr:hypothetical protein TNIN_152751 [Trichonephila inaurata madagascariensis]
MLYIGQVALAQTFCSLMCLPNHVLSESLRQNKCKVADLAVMGPVRPVGYISLGVYVDWSKTRKFSTCNSCPLIAKDVTPIKAKVWTKI